MSTHPQTGLHSLLGSSLSPLLKTAQRQRRTGMFSVRTPGALRNISMLRGEVVFAGSNDREERLNSLLIRRGTVNLRDLTGAVEAMLREGRRLGEILVERRLLCEDDLRSALQTQVEEITCAVLGLRDVEVSFQDRPVPPHDDVGFEVPVNALIHRAGFRVRDFHHIMDDVGGPAAVVTATDEFVAEAEACLMPAPHQTLLPLLGEPKNLVQLCEESALADFDVCRLVWVLLTVGAVSRLE